tara:strand:- start:259 stop:456 length:198 start_codon:yes stop_codon:yes gene_type:complete
LEATDAWPDYRRTDERRHAASHVHHARACEVDLPAQERRAVALVHIVGGGPPVAVPHLHGTARAA